MAPDFALRDQDGDRVTLADFRGRPFAVAFVYSTCEDTCPALVDQVRGALDDTGADMPLLAVSVDPANDTEARAKRFLNERRMTGRATFLLGTEAELAPVWKGYGIQPQTGALDHSAGVVLVDARGPPARRLPARPAHAGGARARHPPARRARPRRGGERVLGGVLAVLRRAVDRVVVGALRWRARPRTRPRPPRGRRSTRRTPR